MPKKLHIAVVGLGFGDVFAPIYAAHPDVRAVTLFDPSPDAVQRTLANCPAARVAASFEEILADPDIDAVHLLSPLLFHASQTLQVLGAGKHCACAVTMGQTLDELFAIVETSARTGKHYMMMETGAYTREFLLARALRDAGELGNLTFLQGNYYQDLEAPYADYWRTIPPMHYATHCSGPMLALAQTRATRVSCIGGGRLRPDICEDPFNPFPFETATFQLENHTAVAQINRAWYQTARQFTESFSAYGDKGGFEWQQLDGEDPVVFTMTPVQTEHRWRHIHPERRAAPLRPDLFPEELAPHTEGWHGGSHPHLVHEFVSAVYQDRAPVIDAKTSADWCAVGLCAHQSALRDGEWVSVPAFG